MSSNKRSGSDFERRIVQKLRTAGISAIRAYASDGRSLGHHPGVDIVAAGGPGWRLQCKHRKRIAEYVKPGPEVDAQIIGDRSGQYVTMTLAKFIELVKALPKETLDLEIEHLMEVQETYRSFLPC